MRTRKHFRLMRAALSEANMKAQGAERAEILIVSRKRKEPLRTQCGKTPEESVTRL